MPKNYAMGGRAPSADRGGACRRRRRHRRLRERLGALRNLPPFLKLVWQTSPALTLGAGAAAPRARAAAGRDALRRQADHRRGGAARRRARRANDTLREWFASGALDRIGWLLALEFALAVASDVLGPRRLAARFAAVGALQQRDQPAADGARGHARPRGLRGQRAAGPAGARAAPGRRPHEPHRASSSARRRTWSPSSSFAAGLIVYAPWLIVLLAIALVPAFIGEAHFNAQSYSLNFARTPERRELDYVRQTGASVETAKEVKIFGLNRVPDRALPHARRRASSRPTAGSRCGARAGAAC